jgi:hypothetical protein
VKEFEHANPQVPLVGLTRVVPDVLADEILETEADPTAPRGSHDGLYLWVGNR